MTGDLESSFYKISRRISSNIRLARLKKRMNQEEFAEFCGLSRTQIRSFENGQGEFRFPNLLRICTALQCDPHQLLKTSVDFQISCREKVTANEQEVKSLVYRSTTESHGDIIRFVLKEKEVFDLEFLNNKIDIFILRGPVHLRTSSSIKEFPQGTSLYAEGSGRMAFINYDSPAADILITKR